MIKAVTSAQAFDLEIRTEIYRKQAFARQYANGKTLKRALAAAGYQGRTESFALELLADAAVIEEMEKIYSLLRSQIAMSKEGIIAQLDEDRSFAYDQEAPAAAISATIAKAKVLGFLDKAETNKLPSAIHIGWGEESAEAKHAPFKPGEQTA